MLTAVGVVPKLLQKPYPPVFLPFASSPISIRWAAREGVTAILPPMHEVYEAPLFDLYAEVSGKPRRQGTGLLRDVIIADTDEEAMALWEDSGRFSGRAWFEPFGYRRDLMDPMTKNFATAKESIDLGYALVGTVDTRSPLKSCSTVLRRSPLPERVGHRCQSGRSCSPSRRPGHPCRTSSRGRVPGRDVRESCRF
jgi:hypothetical protein